MKTAVLLVIWEGPGRIALDAAGEYTLNMSPEAYLIRMTKVDVDGQRI